MAKSARVAFYAKAWIHDWLSPVTKHPINANQVILSKVFSITYGLYAIVYIFPNALHLSEIRHGCKRRPVARVHDNAGTGPIETIALTSRSAERGQRCFSGILEADYEPTRWIWHIGTFARRIRRRVDWSGRLKLCPLISAT